MKKYSIFFIFIFHFSVFTIMGQNLITKKTSYHCKLGWHNCQKCVDIHDYKYALLLLNPSDNPQAARPMIKTTHGWTTYDIKQWFGSLQEAQQYSKNNNIPIETAEEDKYPALQELAKKLPQKWFLKLYEEENKLEIYSPQTLYTYYENKINAPVFMQKSKEETAKKDGKKTYPSITYTLKKPLTQAERKETEQKNALITEKIKKLPEKYNIQHLKPEYVHGKNVYPNYPNATPEEKKRIEAFQKEEELLNSQYIITPMYSTAEFDLWNEIVIGAESATESVYPESISQEVFQVLKTVRDFFSQK
jgi:hypothetical protein